MTLDRDQSSRSASFELERFRWGGPDRLEVSGRFVGLGDAPAGDPVLVLRGPDGTQRLEADPGSVSADPGEGTLWRAEFPWGEAPAAFEEAALELGEDMVVVLPEPSARRRPFARHTLKVRRSAAAATDGETAPGSSTDRLRLQADLIVAREEARQLRAHLEQAREELSLLRGALEEERKRHAEDADRLRGELADMGVAAEEAVAADREAAERLGEQLAEREQSLDRARSETEALRLRLQELEADAEPLRDRVTELERGAEEARADHDRLRAAVEEARGGLEQALHALAAHGTVPEGGSRRT